MTVPSIAHENIHEDNASESERDEGKADLKKAAVMARIKALSLSGGGGGPCRMTHLVSTAQDVVVACGRSSPDDDAAQLGD